MNISFESKIISLSKYISQPPKSSAQDKNDFTFYIFNFTFPEMPIKDDIKTFYNKQAGRFHITRRKHWPELQFILNEIEKLPSQDIKILEL